MASAKDRAVLNSIFNPLLPVGEMVFDEDIPTELKDEDDNDNSPDCQEAKEKELNGVKAAEAGDVEGAIKFFSEAIEIIPSRASGYNNRAQALRLQGNIEGAMADLNQAINLSKGKGRAACQAYTQRAMIHRLQEKDDLARQDFQAAANLGSEFAKAQLVQMNPYAALCNKMLHDVISQLQRGECGGV